VIRKSAVIAPTNPSVGGRKKAFFKWVFTLKKIEEKEGKRVGEEKQKRGVLKHLFFAEV
jgi:hypothetical protein